MTSKDYTILEENWLYRGFISVKRYLLSHKLFAGGWTTPFSREVTIRRNAAAVLPYDPVLDKVVLIEQFRIGALNDPDSPWLHEIVAGLIEENETEESLVRRELQEEAGLHAQQLLRLYSYWASPGATNEYVTLFCAKVDASQAGGIHGLAHEHEDIRVTTMDATTAFQMVHSGKIRNALCLVALLWLQLHHADIRAQWR